MPNGEPEKEKTTREIELEKVTIHRFCRKYGTCLEGPHGEVRAESAQRKSQDLGHLP